MQPLQVERRSNVLKKTASLLGVSALIALSVSTTARILGAAVYCPQQVAWLMGFLPASLRPLMATVGVPVLTVLAIAAVLATLARLRGLYVTSRVRTAPRVS